MIKQIKSGNNKVDIDVLPEDWKIKELGDLCGDICGEYGANKSAIPYSTDLPRYVRITDINDEGNLHFDSKASANLSLEEEKKFKLEHYDLLFARTGATVGKSYLHRNETDEKFVYAGFLIRFRLCPNKVNPIFIKGYTDTSKYWHWVKTYSARSGQPGLNSNEYKSLKIPIPPLPEQKAIADCLRTWDKGIEKLSALITAKKEQKKGLMQGIFSGKLKVENGELVKIKDEKLWLKGWEKVRLGEIGETFNGLTGKTKDDFGEGSPYVSYLNVFNNKTITEKTNFDFVKMKQGENQTQLKYGDLIFTTSSETPNEVGMSGVILFHPKKDLFLNSFCFGLRMQNFEELHPMFAVYLLRGKQFRREMYKLAQGSTRFNLSKSGFRKINLTVPPVEEQTAIAEVLQTADKEIELLEQKLAAFQQQKKGLMQVLLTGEKRLV